MVEASSVNANAQDRLLADGISVMNNVIDGNQDQVDAIYKGFMQRNVDDIATTLSLSLDERNEIQSKLDSMFEDDAYKESIAKMRRSLEQAGFIETARLLRLIQVVERSSLSQEEKDAGAGNIRELAFLVGEKLVSREEAERIERSLTYGRLMDAEELGKNSFSEIRLREWLNALAKRVNAEPEAEKFDVRVSGFLDALQGQNPDAE